MTTPSSVSHQTFSKLPSFDEIEADFALIEDWEERYTYIIDLSRKLAPYPDSAKTKHHLVQGCSSRVWLLVSPFQNDAGQTCLHIEGDSDAIIVKGLVFLVLVLFANQPIEIILACDAEAQFAKLGLTGHLSRQRANGLASMVTRIKTEAKKYLEK